MSSYNTSSTESTRSRGWIRGVNIGGWLLLERFITPYMFALTSCHLQGDFCLYPGQNKLGREELEYCDQYHCKPHLVKHPDTGRLDYPTDEKTLVSSFESPALANEWLNYHFDSFVTLQNVKTLSEAGVTHVRVPIPHWILSSSSSQHNTNFFVAGQRWLYLVRLVGWCRQHQLQVWLDIHTAAGSQNGFDNSGQLLQDYPTCEGWTGVPDSLRVVQEVADAVERDNLQDVVTGIGILNEPFGCDSMRLQELYKEVLNAVRNRFGKNMAVYISDGFQASDWNTGWWTGQDYANTYLDSHYYHAFGESTLSLSPKQHVAFVCQHDMRETQSCCYQDYDAGNTKPSQGISRIVGEWSASFDTLPVAKLDAVMKGIQDDYQAPELTREISKERQDFLRHFVQAQMVAFESASMEGVSSGWFFWTLKMEGGAFAEWDFLRGLREGWIPTLPGPNQSSESVYGTCAEILQKTSDDDSIVHQFPDPKKNTKNKDLWEGPPIDDDVVISHGANMATSSYKSTTKTTSSTSSASAQAIAESPPDSEKVHSKLNIFPLLVIAFFCYAIWRVFFRPDSSQSRGPPSGIHIPSVPNPLQHIRNRGQYTDLDVQAQQLSV